MNSVVYAVLLSLLAGSATGLGAIPLFLKRVFNHRFYDLLTGFGAGVMLAAASFSLIEPAFIAGAWWEVSLGFVTGVFAILILDRIIPHAHSSFTRNRQISENLRRGLLIAGAIAFHNLPEGFAVGVGYLSGISAAGLLLVFSIGLHNISEGFAVAYPFYVGGNSPRRCLGIATLSGLAEPLGTLVSTLLINLSTSIIPYGLSFAGGAMMYVVLTEMIPESHSHGYWRSATLVMILGFILVFALDLLLVH